jgi:hypothetical protein
MYLKLSFGMVVTLLVFGFFVWQWLEERFGVMNSKIDGLTGEVGGLARQVAALPPRHA